MASGAQEETYPMTAGDVAASLGSAVERMIAIKMEAYPSDWSVEDRREMAERQLFGRVG
jgi:hypothetical protein